MTGTRDPAVAGQFYAGDAEALEAQVTESVAHRLGPGDLPTPASGTKAVAGLVVPHAGLPFSGPVAAHAFAALGTRRPDAIVLVGPNHTGLGDALAVSDADRWRTPLGTVPVAADLRDRFLEASAIATRDDAAHRREHSLEVQLPFLQTVYDDPPPILPIAMGRQDREVVTDLVDALSRVSTEGETVLPIASTDLTHYESQSVAEERDAPVLTRIEALDGEGLLAFVERESHSMCGYGPTAAVLEVADRSGATAGDILAYATSGDVTGSTDEVVGYCAARLE